MLKPLRVLIVEDSDDDAELLLSELKSGGYEVTYELVQTAEAMKAAVARGTWDIVISDYSMPTFSGPEALAVKQEVMADVPLIIVSGTIGEETAVSALKAGAHDFLVKGRLARLVPAIERELRDATARRERVRLEAQLRQAQKMEAVGQLAGSVAHDFNNVLTAILGFCEILLSDVDEDAPAHADLLEIQRAGQRAAGLTRQLMAFSRQQVLQPRVHDVNALVSNVEPMLRRLIPENIDLIVHLGADTGSVKIDATQLEQVLVNLVVNARDAMPRGGKLTIRTCDAQNDATRLALSEDPADGLVMLSVTDSGMGMSEATLQRIFEPFFTTKGVGKGTGLGLATIDHIVKQTGGQIGVVSAPGEGTTFKVFLPRAAEAGTSHLEPSHTESEIWRGTETVLVVEDDTAVRLLGRVTLQRAGYRVLEAGNPIEAMRIADDYTLPIDLLLSDVIMPGSEGSPLIERLRVSRSDLRVLYMSGYTDDTIVHHGVLDEGTAFLQKPFTPHALAEKVRQVLDARPKAT